MQTKMLHSLPRDEREQVRAIFRNIRIGSLGGSIYKDQGGHGSQRLGRPSKGGQYREYQLGASRGGGAGKHRIVVEVISDSNIGKVYYSSSHYAQFVEIRR